MIGIARGLRPSRDDGERKLRIAHLFPDLLRVYGDTGNLRTLVVRAVERGIAVELIPVVRDTDLLPPAQLYVIGGGQDRDQLDVARHLERLGDDLVRQVADGAALLAVCGGYQCLGVSYRNGQGQTIGGPGLLDLRTEAAEGRLVGPVVGRLAHPLSDGERPTAIGFENHSGRTWLGLGARPLATVEVGNGNNGVDRGEGLLALPGDGGLLGLRIGTYLHGPLLPRNPHLADALLAAALAGSGQSPELDPIDDRAEWRAHDRYVARCRRSSPADRLPRPVREVVGSARSLVGF